MPGQSHNKAHQIIADRLEQSITPPTARRSEPILYSEGLLVEIIDLARMGFTPAEIADHWSVPVERLMDWARDIPAFAEAIARARTSCQAWWERAARVAMATKDNKFPAGAWAMVMRGRFPEYREKLEVQHNIDVTNRLVVIQRRAPLSPGEDVIEGEARLTAVGT
jgi:hypothetical protein